MKAPSDSSSTFFDPACPELCEVEPQPVKIGGSRDGMCELYRIEKNGRFRVLKCLKPQYRGRDAYEALLRKEYEIGYSLTCPYICEVYAYLRHPDLGNCIEIEWIDGVPLGDYLTSGNVAASRKERIVGQLLEAVAYFHSKQVIHKDLKPSNILITHNGGNVKIIDFGFSDTDGHSILKLSAGTREYAAPELISGAQVDNRADIWSLGKLLLLFGGKWSRAARLCLKSDPAKRCASVEEIQKALGRRTPLYRMLILFIVLVAAGIYLTAQFISQSGDIKADSSDPPAGAAVLPEVSSGVYESGKSRDAEGNMAALPASKGTADSKDKRPAARQQSTPGPAEEAHPVSPDNEIDRIVNAATGLFD